MNSYILSVPEEKKDDYIRIAQVFVDVAKYFGAIEIFENWESDVSTLTIAKQSKQNQVKKLQCPGSSGQIVQPLMSRTRACMKIHVLLKWVRCRLTASI